MRYMYLVYGIAPYSANGYQVVSNYSGTVLSQVTNNSNNLPSPGHTSIVTAVNVTNGTGTISTLEQNASSDGNGSVKVRGNRLQDGVSAWLHHPVSAPQAAPYVLHHQMIADANGDGKADFITVYTNPGDWYVATSTGSSISGSSLWKTNFGQGSDNQFMADVNGDGKADVIAYYGGNSGY